MDLVPRVTQVLDHPMGDQSIFPTYLLSLFARRDVKVALGGDGSDELLMGYRAYKPLKVAWMLDRFPALVRTTLASAARRVPRFVGGHIVRGVRFLSQLDQSPVRRHLSTLGSYRGDAQWVLSDAVRANLDDRPFIPVNELLSDAVSGSPDKQTVISYMRAYLQEDILVKVDRASMAASLEVRAPFLDECVMEFLLAAPTTAKLRRFTGKRLLRQLMRGKIPDEIIDRNKMGFGVPLGTWMRGALAPLVQEYLSGARLRPAGIFDAKAVEQMVSDHLSGRRDRGKELWLLLQFELWRERWLE